jgi:alanine dehydrogenase
MTQLTLGVLGTSAKENEKRVPIHPRHLDRIAPEVRASMLLESGYGDDFGVSDNELAAR